MTAISALFVFQKNKVVTWPLAILIGTLTAFAGGYFSHWFSGFALKVIFSGLLAIAGGSFLVPLMVLACGIPMWVAVGTASALIASTALMGFMGHALQGDFSPALAVPLAAVTIVGGFIGGKFAMKTRPKHLKLLFAYTTLLASLFMMINAFYSRI